MGGLAATGDLELGHLTQTWLRSAADARAASPWPGFPGPT